MKVLNRFSLSDWFSALALTSSMTLGKLFHFSFSFLIYKMGIIIVPISEKYKY